MLRPRLKCRLPAPDYLLKQAILYSLHRPQILTLKPTQLPLGLLMEANMQPHKLTMLPVSAEYYSSSDQKTKQQLLEENTKITERLVSALKSKEEAKAKETELISQISSLTSDQENNNNLSIEDQKELE